MQVLELECPVKQYHWGKRGSKSLVAELKSSGNPEYVIDKLQPYAELWMGTHPSGPAYIRKIGSSLDTWIQTNPSSLGKNVKTTFGPMLPYLFKVLSVEMPLSIQVHPNKEKAEKLHAKYPEIYKDRNHKPELAIALTEFEALCGFRPIDEIKKFIQILPELVNIIGIDLINNLQQSTEINQQYHLKKCFTALMTAKDEDVKQNLANLIQRIRDMEEVEDKNEVLCSLLEKIHSYFPGDVGCFCIYFFNHLVLKPGEAIFLSANEPHAYISGDCIECMATSDNVIRAGLTPKFRDVKTLCEIMNYSCNTAKSKILVPEKENEKSVIYRPPVCEFAVRKLDINNHYEMNLGRSTASISIIINGSARIGDLHCGKGKIIFVSANERIPLQVSDKKSVLLFQAFVNL